ncbi:MAG: hypothetical protein QXV01_09180 [Candidatus Bathyarchaeia archaeon]
MKNDNHKLIFDTSAVTELLNANVLECLAIYKSSAKAQLILPLDVRVELERDEVNSKLRKALEELLEKGLFRVLNPSEETISELKYRYPNLGNGEIGVLAIALTLKKHPSVSVIPILDDEQARNVARKLGLEVHGTLWMLFELKKHHSISKKVAMKVIKQLPDRGFYILKDKLEEITKKIRKDC